jgi:hypothetical protein
MCRRGSIQEVLRVLKHGGKLVSIRSAWNLVASAAELGHSDLETSGRRLPSAIVKRGSNSITLGFGKLTYNNFKAPSPIVGPQIMVTAVNRPRHRRSRTKRKWTVRVCVVR